MWLLFELLIACDARRRRNRDKIAKPDGLAKVTCRGMQSGKDNDLDDSQDQSRGTFG